MLSGDFLNKKNKGFTLIELLVVVSIIGLLSTVVLASVQKVRTDAKWRKFESELISIRTAVQLYRENHNGEWPPSVMNYNNPIETLLSELKASGVYLKDTIDYPELMYVGTEMGSKININYKYSCGKSNYSDTYLVIVFWKKPYSFTPFLNTKLPFLWESGNPYNNVFDGYIYCVEI
jgi:prepilin-type N-terminal cleavage/methylation domain-containing protein